MGFISIVAEESASVLNPDNFLVSTTLVLTPNMQRIIASIALQGQILFLTRWWMQKKFKKIRNASNLLLFSTFCNKKGLW
jgi:hypothetical protein